MVNFGSGLRVIAGGPQQLQAVLGHAWPDLTSLIERFGSTFLIE